MIRFRTLMFLLSMTILTALASYTFFEPFTRGGIPQAVLDVNSDTNPYDNDFFTPDNSGLRSSRLKGMKEELVPALETPLPERRTTEIQPERRNVPFCVSFLSKHENPGLLLSDCRPVRAGPRAV